MSGTWDDHAAATGPRGGGAPAGPPADVLPGAVPATDVAADEGRTRSLLAAPDAPDAADAADAPDGTVRAGGADGADGDDAGALTRLRADLAVAAEAADLLDVAYRTLATPVGELLLAATPRGLVRVAFDDHDAVLGDLSTRVSPRVLRAPARLEAVVRQLEEYFAGARTTFEVPLDLRLARGFRLAVVERLPEVAYGSTTTYTALAALAGSPAAVRAVGTACARNPLPVVVPCHRVLRADGGLGGYIGGVAAKRTLLALEGAHPAA
ncbi:methylated-DNA--[protein]-cysteine S-methyltransferase [Georgenia wangjunii]|uniref:methylated-DNA--[protein]-cysteine S-methyltransferase n=1 Tax=Georgenia wangjunii TaxID=3117730 RepID=UPI003D9C4939